jgi:hypothetical protein
MNEFEREDLREQRERHKQRMADFQRGIVERELTRPLPDPIEKWREKSERARAERERAKRRLAAPPPAPSPSIDERIRAFAEAERRYILSVTSEAIGEFLGGEARKFDGAIGELRREVAALRASIADAKMALQTTRGETRSLERILDSVRAENVALRDRLATVEREADRARRERRDGKVDAALGALGETIDRIDSNVFSLRESGTTR